MSRSVFGGVYTRAGNTRTEKQEVDGSHTSSKSYVTVHSLITHLALGLELQLGRTLLLPLPERELAIDPTPHHVQVPIGVRDVVAHQRHCSWLQIPRCGVMFSCELLREHSA